MKQPLTVFEATLQLVRQTSGPFTMPRLLPSLLALFPGNSADETRLRLCDSLILLRQRGVLDKVGTSLPTTYQRTTNIKSKQDMLGGLDPRHKFIQQLGDDKELKAARHEARKRKSLKYRHEHLEERRLLERHWHRVKSGMDLEAPVMTKYEVCKKGSAIRWGKVASKHITNNT